MSRLEQRLAMAIETQLAAGRDLIRIEQGLLVSREHGRAIACALRLAVETGAEFEHVSRDAAGDWHAHLIHPLGRFIP